MEQSQAMGGPPALCDPVQPPQANRTADRKLGVEVAEGVGILGPVGHLEVSADFLALASY